jgi:hypothetical protein
MHDVKVALEEVKGGYEPASPKEQHNPLLLVASAVVVLAVLLLTLNASGWRERILGRKAAAALNPKRVAVATFEKPDRRSFAG